VIGAVMAVGIGFALSVAGPIPLSLSIVRVVSMPVHSRLSDCDFGDAHAEIASVHIPEMASVEHITAEIWKSLYILGSSNTIDLCDNIGGRNNKLFKTIAMKIIWANAVLKRRVCNFDNFRWGPTQVCRSPYKTDGIAGRAGDTIVNSNHYLPAFQVSECIEAALSGISSAAGFVERRPNQANTNGTQHHATESRASHEERPKGSYALGLKIALVAGIGALGVASLGNAIRLVGKGQTDAGAQCWVIGVLLIFACAFSSGPLIYGLFG
jgi:hypothetical protein